MTEERNAHSVFAPSASHRWLACPASLVLTEQAGIEEGAPSSYAHEGIVCHDISAECLRENKTPDVYLNDVVDNVLITQELVDAMQVYIDDIKGIAKEIGAKGGKIEFEVDITDDCWGTLDAFMWTPEVAVINDLKMGKGVIVEAENNPQLMLYAIGGLKYLVREHELKPEKVILRIIQPRTVNPIRVWQTDREVLIRWFQDYVRPAMERVKNGDTECHPGSTQCRWCPVAPTCVAQTNKLLADAEMAFSSYAVDVEGLLPLEKITELLPKFEQIQNWMNTVKEYALNLALSGKKVPGYKLVRGRSNRKWGADEEQVVSFLKAEGVNPYEEKLISPTQAEKSMGKKKVKASNFDKYVVKPLGKPTLVPDSDTRPEMEQEVEETFKDFVEEEAKDVMIVDDSEEDKGITSVWDRLKMGDDDYEPDTPSDSVGGMFDMSDSSDTVEQVEEQPDEIATSGNQGEKKIAVKMVGKDTKKSPRAGTKRLEVLNFGKGGVTISEVAKALGCTENMVKMHLRYLNEQDGYEVIIYDDDEFIVK